MFNAMVNMGENECNSNILPGQISSLTRQTSIHQHR